ncbi:MAG TPA: DUF92 domain-containing protein [Polyangiaceae bacterium]|nr:DUF92 domain-containing protein [Polyangiaceae bacterium]
MPVFARFILGFILSLAIAAVAVRRGSLSRSGGAAAVLIGTGIYAGGGGAWFFALVTFFVSSTLLGRVGRARKATIKREFEKGDTRDAKQALANGGIALLCSLAMLVSGNLAWSGAFVGALSTANADTWATELGVLSRGEPLSLTRFKHVPRGTSGAISALGLVATAGGALAIGLVAAAAHQAFMLSSARLLILALAAGVVGSLTDSLLGATLQGGYHCAACDRSCEGGVHHCGHRTRHVRGLRWLDNDCVNLAATLMGAAVGALIAVSGEPRQ